VGGDMIAGAVTLAQRPFFRAYPIILRW